MFSVEEIVKATGARLICGRVDLKLKAVSIDSRKAQDGRLFVAIKGSRFDGHSFIPEAIKKGARAVVLSYIPKHRSYLARCQRVSVIKVKDTKKALGDLAAFHRRRFNIPVIAVTGSNGKTTTKEMLAWILQAKFNTLKNKGTENNDIGLSLNLLRLSHKCRAAILELGTNHFGEIAYLGNILRPNIVIINNIGPAHLEFFRDLNGVLKEKMSLLKYLSFPRIAILNNDDAQLKGLNRRQAGFTPPFLLTERHFEAERAGLIINFGLRGPCDYFGSYLRYRDENTEFRIHNQKIHLSNPSLGNVYNALAAIAASRILGFDYLTIKRRLESFTFPPRRLQIVKKKNLIVIDDTYNANPESLDHALDVLERMRPKGRRIFILGDMLELGDSAVYFHRHIAKRISRICDAFISVGPMSFITSLELIKQGLDGGAVFYCSDSKEARKILFKKLQPRSSDLVLIKGSRAMKMEEVLR